MPILNRRQVAMGLGALALAAPRPARAARGPLDERLDAFFEEVFAAELRRRPLKALSLGLKINADKLDDNSEAGAEADMTALREALARLDRDFAKGDLDPASRLAIAQFRYRARQAQSHHEWRFHLYPLTTTFGDHVDLPAALINDHAIETPGDADDYLARLAGFETYFANLTAHLARQEAMGIKPPRFFFPVILDAARAQIAGRPFDEGDHDAPLLADVKRKVAALPVAASDKAALIARAEDALRGPVRRAYAGLIDWLTVSAQSASDADGVWKLPNGAAFYAARLRWHTGLPLTAERVHRIGLGEVTRIHGEIRAIMAKVGFTGGLSDFFAFMRDDPRFYYPDDAAGRAAYLAEATAIIDAMRTRLDAMFATKPKAPLDVRAVEPFREASAAAAFYQPASADGRRPAHFYVNLSAMRSRPRHGLETMAYHEGVPGHHLQTAIAQELVGVPRFQALDTDNSAFDEGWALYAERLGKEMGFFTDPYSDFGRLAGELWRSIRLVVDTGIHAKKWTWDQATQYFVDHSAMDRAGAAAEVARYIGNPGQATAYKIGMMKILELRALAQRKMGPRFTIKGFHEIVLGAGSVPFDLLESRVKDWIERA